MATKVRCALIFVLFVLGSALCAYAQLRPEVTVKPKPKKPPAAKVKPKPAEKPAAKRIRVRGQVESAKRIFRPQPEYPPLAKMARIQGTVRLEAIIARDGTIQELKLVSGHPLLVKAAFEAVERWRYQPTLLQGEPVEVVTEIDVIFALAE